MPSGRPPRKLLVFDTAYTWEATLQRGQVAQIYCRDLDGFFDHVWSVHPFASLLTSDAWGPKFGEPATYEVAPRHTVVEGKIGRFSRLRWLPPLNFALSQLQLGWRLLRLIRRERISAIRASTPLYVGLFAWVLARLAGVPLVIRVGANFDELRQVSGQAFEPRIFRSQAIEKRVERFVLRRADLVAGANQNNLDYARANGASRDRSTLFRYGNLIDPRHFVDPGERSFDPALLDELGLRGERFMISIGRLEAKSAVKHPEDVVETVAAFSREGLKVKALLVGDGPLRAQLADLARELGVEDRVILGGSRSQEWLAQILPQAAVHVCPHAGRALSEAALAALPTVAYDIDWQGELIETGVTGVLVSYRDKSGLINGTRQLLNDRATAAALGQNLRKRALEMLDPKRLDEHERAAYAQLLAQPRGASGNDEQD